MFLAIVNIDCNRIRTWLGHGEVWDPENYFGSNNTDAHTFNFGKKMNKQSGSHVDLSVCLLTPFIKALSTYRTHIISSSSPTREEERI